MKKRNFKQSRNKKVEIKNPIEIKLSKLKKILKNLIISFIAFVLFSIGYQLSPIIIFFILALVTGVLSLSFFMILLIVFFLRIFRKK